jgi:hypothetical protein
VRFGNELRQGAVIKKLLRLVLLLGARHVFGQTAPEGIWEGYDGGVVRPYRSEPRVYELGFHLRPAFWNRGLATEAAGAVIRYAFTTLAAEGLFAGHHRANHVS